ncbi:MAG: amino acid ABC transporter permease [Chloroflexota bacterium]|nr:amino acid ABC transporter permease [Chloroflexota bacterium]
MTAETLPPPRTEIGVVGWLRKNLFSGIVNSLVTIVLAVALGWLVLQLGTWAVTEARWEVITDNLRLFLVGRYPGEETWRIWVAMLILSVLAGLSGAAYGQVSRVLAITLSAIQLMLALLMLPAPIGITAVAAYGFNAAVVWAAMIVAMRVAIPRRALVGAWLVSLPVTFFLLAGFAGTPLASVSTNAWGGLLLTVLLAVVGIVLSFPMGVILALGRRSELPALRWLSTGYIELIRGVPLVTILFMADIILPLFVPSEWRLDRVARAMGGITLFSAAYVAENVRGGLQAIPSGQIEAARALGLSGIQLNRFIVLPQALRSVIPANVGLFISLLKDTTLVTIIGLLELLGIGSAVLAQSESFGANMEVYAFVAAVFFVLCYAMSQASYRLERALGVGTR